MATWTVERIVATAAIPYGGLEPSSEVYVAVHGRRALLIDAGTSADVDTLGRVGHALRGATAAALVLTHHHPDHALAALALARHLDIPIFADKREHAALQRLWQGRESERAHRRGSSAARARLDRATLDERRLVECPDQVQIGDEVVTFIRTPGHTHGHVCAFIANEGRLFSGDAVVPSGTVWIGPPDGHMSDYLSTLALLEALHPSIIHPGHGDDILAPIAAIQAMIARRREREDDIVRALCTPRTATELAEYLYGGRVSPSHMWAARKTCVAHLERLLDQQRVSQRFASGRGLVYSLRDGQDGY
ncbi:MAG: MBL fold metallo-hydrolase [Firmicutes bacterium]|nr:MBL fold metallo-hydrolase [Bacillota bacterium]